MHRPLDASRRLGISTSTLRRWAQADHFGPWLSAPAGRIRTTTGGHHARSYTAEDLAFLTHVKRVLAAGLTVAELVARLDAGDPVDVVARDSDTTGGAPEDPLTNSPTSDMVSALARAERVVSDLATGGDPRLGEVVAMLQEVAALQREALDQAVVAQAESLAVQRELLAELRAQRRPESRTWRDFIRDVIGGRR